MTEVRDLDKAGLVWRCMECGNEISADSDSIRAADMVDGSKGPVHLMVHPVCRHGLPYHMQLVPRATKSEIRHPRKNPKV